MKSFSLKSILLFLSLGWILSSGCTTLRPLSLDVLIPPDTLIYPGLKSATIVYQNRLIVMSDSLLLENPDSLVADSVFRKKLIEECTQGLIELLETSPGIDSVKIDTIASKTVMLFTNSGDTLDEPAVSDICFRSKTDIVIILEGIYAWDTLFDSYIFHGFEGETGEAVLYDNMGLAITSRWSVFEASSQNLLERYLYADTVIWSSDVYQVMERTIELPSPEKAYMEAFYWAGNGYGKRIVSTWDQVERFYYCTNNDMMKKACLEATNNNWREAAIIWKELAGHKDKKLAAKAAFNMALVCELEDRLELAQNWVINSFLLNKTWASEEYLEILNRRLFLKKKYKF